MLLSLDHEVPGSNPTRGRIKPALPQSGKKVWKMKFFPGQGKVRKVWFESGKLAKIGKSQGKVREFQNFIKSEMSMAVLLIFRNFQNRFYCFVK